MKKILTTTVMTAILATSGFAADEPVDYCVYGTVDFPSGTDNNPTTITPSGTVDIGCTGSCSYINSDWTLEPGSTMNVTGDGFGLNCTLNINPQNAGAVPVQCNLLKNGNLYYEYTDSATPPNNVYKLVDSSEDSYVNKDGEPVDKPDGELKQTMSKTVTGSPILAEVVNRENAVITISTGGAIKGGIVTYVKKDNAVLESDSTDLGSSSTLNGKTKYKLTKAESDSFQEEYLSKLPNLVYYDAEYTPTKLNLSAPATIAEENFASNDTLKTYLNSFGFYPDPVTVSEKTGLELITEKTAGDVIQIPADSEFSKAANNETCTISTNLHNVGVGEVTNALKFTGTGATWDSGWNYDTLVFSGDNRNLVPECGVTYTDVNLTFCDANSWIAAPKDKAVSISGYDATVTICKDMELYHDLEIAYGTNFKGPENTKILVYGKLTFK